MEYIPESSLSDASSNSEEEEVQEQLKKKKDSRCGLLPKPKTYKLFREEVHKHLASAYDKERSLLLKEEWKPRFEDWRPVRYIMASWREVLA